MYTCFMFGSIYKTCFWSIARKTTLHWIWSRFTGLPLYTPPSNKWFLAWTFWCILLAQVCSIISVVRSSVSIGEQFLTLGSWDGNVVGKYHPKFRTMFHRPITIGSNIYIYNIILYYITFIFYYIILFYIIFRILFFYTLLFYYII